jgi:HSP20 family protein
MTLYAYPFPHRMARRWMASSERERAARYLPVNVRDESEAFVLTALAPGLKAEDLKIEVLDDVVRIEGEFPIEENEYLLQEVAGGSFQRELRLPAPLDADKVEARIADGILTLRLPKAESARPKTIKVEAK